MRLLKFILCSLLLSQGLIAKDFSGPYSAAQDAFRQGDFEGSTRIYLEAIQSGQVNGSVFYNLGTSLYKNGELGASMAAHLRAQSLAPDDPDIRYNLRFLQEKTKDKLDIKLPQAAWKELNANQWLGERALFWWTLVLLVSALSLLALILWTGRFMLPGCTAVALLAIGSLYPGLSLADRLWWKPDWGAVIAPDIDVLASPTVKNAVVIFQLHEGAPFAVVNESGDWFKIQLSDGKTGWVPREHVAIFGKRYFSYQTSKNNGSPKNPQL